MIIDTHCHLTFPEFDDDRVTVIGNAKKAGVKHFIVPGVDLLSSKQAVLLAENHPDHIRAAIGFHPYEAQEEPSLIEIESLLNQYVVAIGECGLDYHMYKNEAAVSKKTNQIRIFSDHLALASKHHLPLIMHCRDAFDDFFPTIDRFPETRGVIHCFSGGLEDIRMAKKRNLYMGIDGNLTYSKHLQSILTSIPIELLLFETDAPYLTPIPFRGKRNQPKFLSHTISYAATLLNVSVEMLITQTTNNAYRLFGFPLPG